MPIKPENRHHYRGVAWKAIRAAKLEEAGNCCELCFVPNGSQVYRDDRGRAWLYRDSEFCRGAKREPTTVVLTIAHINQDPTDNRPVNLRALCQRCHNLIDLPYRTLHAAATRAAKQTEAPCDH
jgi:hypothetical protein